ncbi:hypothetical protein Syun_029612 [Stephania yunnanensis]|uniref:Uncharacterized protein n=1 Tax=Stephania yunnanensis TaxID=152371 RepID=A0AAP0EDI0_9MAGN
MVESMNILQAQAIAQVDLVIVNGMLWEERQKELGTMILTTEMNNLRDLGSLLKLLKWFWDGSEYYGAKADLVIVNGMLREERQKELSTMIWTTETNTLRDVWDRA